MKEKQGMIVLKEKQKKESGRVGAILTGALSGMGIAAGVTAIFFVLGEIRLSFLPILAAVLAAFVAFAGNGVSGGRSYGSLFCLLVAVVWFFVFRPSAVRGFYGWARAVLSLWNQAFGTFYGGSVPSGYTEADLHTAEFILSLLAAAAVCELVERKRLLFLTLLVFVPLCACLLLGLGLPFSVLAVLIVGWLAAWCGLDGSLRLRVGLVAPFVVAAILLFLFSVPHLGNQWQSISAEFKRSVKLGMESFRFGTDSLPRGDLTRAFSMLEGEEKRLELEMEETAPLYLRGFVGSVYAGNQWKPFSAKAYEDEYAGMLSWLREQGFDPGKQYAAYQNASPEGAGRTAEVTVKNIGASRRYVYLPETVAFDLSADGAFQQDWSMEASGWFGEKDYSFTYYPVQSHAETSQPGRWLYRGEGAGRFRQAELMYRSFVYDRYLELDESQKAAIDLVFFQGGDQEAGGLYSVTSRLRAVLQILAEYREVPDPVPRNREFLEWFLDGGRKANAAYYASVAVLVYRAAGIPARYAEGYVLTKEQAAQTEGNQVLLSEKNAHAWAEVYVDGMGWMAVEVTPGFYEEAYEADVVVAVPREDFGGTGTDVAGIQREESYELPEEMEDLVRPEKTRRSVLFLSFLSLFLLLRCVSLIRSLSFRGRYLRMTREEQFLFLYQRIMEMAGRLYPDFHSDLPFELPEDETPPFDRALYERTVRRMEKLVYGGERPVRREIRSAEILAAQFRLAVRKQNVWMRKVRKKRHGSH